MKSLLVLLVLFSSFYSFAGTEPYISEVALYSTNFCPRHWVEADGRRMNKEDNQTLFSLLGYTYGGSGKNFKLPDLREMTPKGMRYCVAIYGSYPSRN